MAVKLIIGLESESVLFLGRGAYLGAVSGAAVYCVRTCNVHRTVQLSCEQAGHWPLFTVSMSLQLPIAWHNCFHWNSKKIYVHPWSTSYLPYHYVCPPMPKSSKVWTTAKEFMGWKSVGTPHQLEVEGKLESKARNIATSTTRSQVAAWIPVLSLQKCL